MQPRDVLLEFAARSTDELAKEIRDTKRSTTGNLKIFMKGRLELIQRFVDAVEKLDS